ncbi:MAG: Coenzyme F420 hydrogenase/dehydrogenase, beta subunit C-terminal domain [Kiritimatiellae bacterium]|nr:Coenzyme F420 hydrogenase/dehydrogenase, beta subunit C-terminal domain [Kiritimatiellia bacterium]
MNSSLAQTRQPFIQFAAKTKNRELLRASSSGGAFSELAQVVLAQGGAVFGAGWDEHFHVVHKCIETEMCLGELRGSKYVQSKLNDAPQKIKELLAQGRMILFSGTPCQVAAIRKQFGESPLLLLCSIMCHSNVPSGVWEKYLREVQDEEKDTITAISFRDKRISWRKYSLTIEFARAGHVVSQRFGATLYGKIFFSGFATLPACFHCPFRQGKHGADLMIGDYWGIEKSYPNLNDDDGVSAILVFTEQGRKFLQESALSLHEVAYSTIPPGNMALGKCISSDEVKRQRFQRAWQKTSLKRAYIYATEGPWYRRFANHTLESVERVREHLSRVKQACMRRLCKP